MEAMYFDNDKPEYKNIKYSNINSKYAEIYNGNKWVKNLISSIIDEILDSQLYNLEELINLCKENYKYKNQKIKASLLNIVKIIIDNNKLNNNDIEYLEENNSNCKDIKLSFIKLINDIKLIIHNKTIEIYK